MKKCFNTVHLIIHLILTFKTFLFFRKFVLKCHIIFWLLIASNNPSHFRTNLLDRIKTLIMTVDYKIKDEKLLYNIDREAAKISVLSCRIVKYEYLTGEETLPPDQRRVIQQVKFLHPPLGKAYENQIKMIEHQREKQI